MKTIIQNQAKQSSIYGTQFGTITQLVITQIFQLFVGLISVTWCSFYFFIFYFFPTPNTQTHRNQWKKKKKKNQTKTKPVKGKRKKKKKKPPSMKGKRKKRRWRNQTHWTQKRKKKGSKVTADSDHVTHYIFLITEMPLKTELWKLKTLKICFQFP